MSRGTIRTFRLEGSPLALGHQHGQAYRDEIRRYTETRITRVCSGEWSVGRRLGRGEVLDLAAVCLPAHESYAPDLYEEMVALAEACGLTPAELIITGGYTDFVDLVSSVYGPKLPLSPELAVDDCTAFLVPGEAAGSAGIFGQTWDMHPGAVDHVLLLEIAPDGGPEALVFTTTGCLGQIGMNAHGIAVGINNLLGADGQVGVTWPFVVRKALQQDNLDDALACITEVELAGAHNFMLMDREGRGVNVEAMPSHRAITPLDDVPLVHTNHCLLEESGAYAMPRTPESQASSEARLEHAMRRLETRPVTIEGLQALTREVPVCCHPAGELPIETCGAAIMRPATREFWAVWGVPSENEYRRYTVGA